MVAYEDEGVYPKPRAEVWNLLDDHLDDAKIRRIHSLISVQKTVQRTADETVVERWIDFRGKALRSIWRITYRPPDATRWEIVESQGPWAAGSFLENTYSDAPGGTLIRSKGDLRLSVLPFFIPQRSLVRRVLDTIQNEDLAYKGP